MARVFITGSSDGLGLLAARLLVQDGHEVVLHARSAARAADACAALPQAEAVVVGDLSTIAAMRAVADQANAFGQFDAVIHNVGIGYQEPRPVKTADGLSQLFAVNTLAPYLLTALITRPKRLVYLSSGLHSSGDPSLEDLQWERRPWNGLQAYSDTKLHDALLAFAVASRWPETFSNAVEPGWVPTKMGGPSAPDDLVSGAVTQAWLATSGDPHACMTGAYFYHQQQKPPHPAVERVDVQDLLLDYCRELAGVEIA